jgi:DNA repair protein RecO (recombination protein O)
MPGSVKTEGIVLRSLRYGEADRILHVYTPERGRVSAIAKGVRKTRSRFGGRLEPFFRLRLVLHEGRSDLMTVTSVETVEAHPRLRADGPALDAAARACDAVARLFDAAEPSAPVFHLLANELALLDAAAGTPATHATHANQLAFRLKLLLAAGPGPQLAACANCGEPDHLVAFSGAAGGVVCSACEGGAFPLGQDAHAFMAGALGAPLAGAPSADARALRQAERAIAETVEHHAHTRLRRASPGVGRLRPLAGLVDQPPLHRPPRELVAGGELELAQDRGDVGLDRLGRDAQARGDLLVEVARGQVLEDLALAGGEQVELRVDLLGGSWPANASSTKPARRGEKTASPSCTRDGVGELLARRSSSSRSRGRRRGRSR